MVHPLSAICMFFFEPLSFMNVFEYLRFLFSGIVFLYFQWSNSIPALALNSSHQQLKQSLQYQHIYRFSVFKSSLFLFLIFTINRNKFVYFILYVFAIESFNYTLSAGMKSSVSFYFLTVTQTFFY